MADIDWAKVRAEALGEFTLADLPPTLKLPALPHAVALFLEKSKDPDIDVRVLAGIVETDTGLTLELLRHVNSTFIGLRQKAKTVQQALMVLGLRQSKLFLVATGTQAAIKARKSKLLNQSCFWNATLQKAIFARQVAKLLRADADVAFAGALLQDYLLPVLTNDLLDGYIRFTEARDRQPECLCDYERQEFGWDHALAAACLAYRWKLPDDLVCCLLFHHHGLRILTHPQLGRSPVAAVALSALLPDQFRQHFRGLEQLTLLEQKWPAFDLKTLIEEVDQRHQELGLGVQNDFPLTRRCRSLFQDAPQPSACAAAS